jgi:phage terminase small subunit
MAKKKKKTGKKKLTPKQKLFVKEYIVDLHITNAAIRAGYSKKTAYSIGSENLRKPEIQAAIQEEFAKRAERIEVTQDYVLEGFIEVAERCLQRKPVMAMNYKTREMEQVKDEKGEGMWQFDSTGANKAFTKLGEHLGLFKKVFSSDPDNPLFPPIQIIRPEDVDEEGEGR